MNKVKRRPKIFSDLIAEGVQKEKFEDKVSSAIADMYKNKIYFSSIKYVQEVLADDYNIEIKTWRLMHLMHHNLGMRYKKVSRISWQSNSDKNLILRHQFAYNFLKIDHFEKVVINVDETWLGMMDFR